jgi:hypothetical protein
MDTYWPDYMEAPVRHKLTEVMQTVIEKLPEKPDKAFVCTDRSVGARSYFCIWLFTQKLMVKIRNSLNQDRIQYEMYRFENAVDWIRLNARRYDFKKPMSDSQLDLEFTTTDGVSDELSATGEGCHYLMEIYHDRFLSNFVATRGQRCD